MSEFTEILERHPPLRNLRRYPQLHKPDPEVPMNDEDLARESDEEAESRMGLVEWLVLAVCVASFLYVVLS